MRQNENWRKFYCAWYTSKAAYAGRRMLVAVLEAAIRGGL
jgi:hypothetical protein